jgi:16S rRNA (guanine527-N7)-methyltransferase
VLATLVNLVRADDDLPVKWKRAAWNRARESLNAVDDVRVRGARRMADLGSGAGFPGLVLAGVLPQARVTLVEYRSDRHRFLQRAIDAMGLTNVEVVTVTAQRWAEGIGTCDLVTSRNLAPPNVVVELAAPLLAMEGTAILWTGVRNDRDEADGEAAAAATGLRREEIRPIARKEHLHVYVKVAETPACFPRSKSRAFRDPIRAHGTRDHRRPDPASVRLEPLERQALELLAEGAGLTEIAQRLDLPLRQVRRELRHACRKLEVRDRREAVALARESRMFE